MSNRVRVNLSLKEEDIDLIDHFADQLGLSRATCCTVLIKRSLGTVSKNYGSVPLSEELFSVDDIEEKADLYYKSLEP